MPTRILLRGGTAAAWAAQNPILAAREPALETDTGRWKFGDGTTHWNALAYAAGVTTQALTQALAGKASTTHATTHAAGGTDPLTLTTAQITGLTTALTAKADLTPAGVLPTNQLPPLSITSVYVVANQAAMLALTAQTGDVASRTDTSRTYILAASPATTLANWVEVTAPGAVLSVAGKTGTVALAGEDITSGTVPYARLPIGQAAGTVAAGNDARFADYATRITALEQGTTPPAPGITVPGAPTAVSAIPGVQRAGVSFTAPASNGGAAITSYTVTASTGQTATGATSPIQVTGLTAGVAVTFTVKAKNSAGTGPASTASAAVTPLAQPTGGGAPTFVQQLGVGTLTVTGSTVEVTTTAAASVGNSIILAMCCNGDPGSVTITDSVANTYRADGAPVANGAATSVQLFSSRLVTALPSGSKITLTFGSPRNLASLQAHEFSGLPTSAVDDIGVGTANASADLTTGQLTTTAGNALVVSAWAMAGNATPPTYTPGTGWTAAGQSSAVAGSSGRDLFVEWKVQATASDLTPAASVAPSKNWCGVAVAFPAIDTGGAVGSGATGTYSTFNEMQAAASIAVPGDTITLAPNTTFAGRLELTGLKGAAQHPITITGPRTAVIQGTATSAGYGVHLDLCEYVIVHGFTVTTFLKGVIVDRSPHCTIEDLEVMNIGNEGIHLRNESSYGVVQRNTVHDTGLTNPKYGEGLYCGQAQSNWTAEQRYPTAMLGYPDHCDFCQFLDNVTYNTTGESIDIKEGTYGGVVRGNTFGGQLIKGANSADSWIDVKGESWTIEGNTGTTIMTNGFETHKIDFDTRFLAPYTDGLGVSHPGVKSGDNNVFDGNVAHCAPATGYGFWIHSESNGNKVYDNNVVDGAPAGVANVPTVPKP